MGGGREILHFVQDGMSPYKYIPILAVLFSLSCNQTLADGTVHLPLTQKDYEHARSAFYFSDHERWSDAMYYTRGSDISVVKLLHWLRYRAKNSGASFEEITRFIVENPDWPEHNILLQRAEEAITLNTDNNTIIKWFTTTPPVTGDGVKFFALAKAARAKSPAEQKEVLELIRQAWIKGNFGSQEEREFLVKYRNYLRTSDHEARIDQLLWQGKITLAQSLFSRADTAHQRLFTARILLIQSKGNIDGAINAVPAFLQRDAGLIYDRLLWNDRKGNTGKVTELLRLMPESPPYPGKWWEICNNNIRALLRDRKFKAAYELASKNLNLKGEDFAESEWLSGWIALRFLNNTHVAYKHFYSLFQGTQYPISKGRGAYWAGRASEKNGNTDIAVKWYQVASAYKDTFYGQLSILKLDRQRGLNLPQTPQITDIDIQNYKRNELVKAAALLVDVRHYDLAKKMVVKAIINAKNPGEMALITQFGQSMQRFELSVEASKQAARKGVLITKTSYPLMTSLPESKLELPLSLAIIRQESGFDRAAQSQVGAIGLMQLMPHTAASLAKELHVKYDKRQLTNQSYNIKLGTHYLQKLINYFNGSYIMAIAAYNGGQGNVHKWVREYGDPRKSRSLDEVIDWIEFIPFSETRNYTQRIMENLQVYRELLHKHNVNAPGVMLELDLKR